MAKVEELQAQTVVSPQDKLPHDKKGMLILLWLLFTLQNNHLLAS